MNKLTTSCAGFAVLMTLGLAGCESGGPGGHQQWHHQVARAAQASDQQSARGSMVSVEDLQAMAGPPDYRMRLGQLQQRMPGSDTYRSRVTGQLALGYEDTRQAAARSAPGPLPELEQCMLWIYDESRHFSKPMDRNQRSGYYATVFYVFRNAVLGSETLIMWQPLR
jgi:hypothetical protein